MSRFVGLFHRVHSFASNYFKDETKIIALYLKPLENKKKYIFYRLVVSEVSDKMKGSKNNHWTFSPFVTKIKGSNKALES